MRRLIYSIQGLRAGTVVALTTLIGCVAYFLVLAINAYCIHCVGMPLEEPESTIVVEASHGEAFFGTLRFSLTVEADVPTSVAEAIANSGK